VFAKVVYLTNFAAANPEIKYSFVVPPANDPLTPVVPIVKTLPFKSTLPLTRPTEFNAFTFPFSITFPVSGLKSKS